MRDCEFFDSEKTAADAKDVAEKATARHQAVRQAEADAEAKRMAAETAAFDESSRQASAIASVPETPPPGQLQLLLLPAALNDKLRRMIRGRASAAAR